MNYFEAKEFALLLGRLEGNACLFQKHIVEVNLEGSGSFSRKSYSTFCAWSGFLFLPPFSQVWKTKTTKIKILGWLVSHGRADTCDQIQKKRTSLCISLYAFPHIGAFSVMSVKGVV